MPSIKGFPLLRAVWALAALALAVLAAAGLGPRLGSGDVRTATAADLSASCAAPGEPLPDAATSRDSDLAALIAVAARSRPGRVRLLTDGCDRSGAVPAVPPAPPVDVVLLPRRDDVILLDLRLPGRIRPGVDFAVEIEVGRTAGPARPPVVAAVELRRDGERVGGPRHRVRLVRGQRRRIRIRDRVDRPGLVHYTAEVVDRTGGSRDDDRRAAVTVAGQRPLVLACRSPALPADRFDLLGVEPGDLGRRLAEPGLAARLDALVLGGAPVPEPAQRLVARAVRGGAGLVLLGGAGYAGGPLDPLLPLSDAPPHGRATLLALDFSGSMEPLKQELVVAVERLRATLAPDDRLAFVAFSGEPFAESVWTRADRVDWDLRRFPARGATRLLPALERAARLLALEVRARRRLFVVSDGKWQDRTDPRLAAALDELRGAGTFLAALFVEKESMEPIHARLFPVRLFAGDDLASGLARLDEAAPDRLVEGPVLATRAAAPPWLAGAVPLPGPYSAVVRLYPRGRGEAVPLRAGELPLLGAWTRPGGRVVELALARSADPQATRALPGLVRACLRPSGDVRLAARRTGRALEVDVFGGEDQPVTLDGAPVAARPVGPGQRRVRVDPAPAGTALLACGAARLLVAPLAAAEFAGLDNRPDIAAAIAARTGGRLLEPGSAAKPPRRAPAPYVLLLGAALLVLLSAWLRARRGGGSA